MNVFNIIWEFKFYILCIMFYKCIINIIYLNQVSKLHSDYFDWLDNKIAYYEIAKKKHTFKTLVKKSNVMDAHLPTTQPMGFGHIASFSASVSENFPNNSVDFATITNDMFCEMEGIFKNRILETFNPLYWLNLVIYLPKNLVEYLGLSSDNIGSKVLQLIWWLIGIIGTVLIELYPEYLRQLISSYLPILP